MFAVLLSCGDLLWGGPRADSIKQSRLLSFVNSVDGNIDGSQDHHVIASFAC